MSFLYRQTSIDAFIVSVLPGRARVDADRFEADLFEPQLECF